MLKDLKIFVVHESKLIYRRRFIETQLDKIGIDYEFVMKFDSKNLTKDVLDTYYDNDPNNYEYKTKVLWGSNNSAYKELSRNEISCTLKHRECIKLASEREGDSLIIEDDCLFCEDFLVKLNLIGNDLPENWGALFLGLGCGLDFQKHMIQNSSQKYNDNIYLMKHPATNCAECYLVNQNSAKTILKDFEKFNLISDWELAYIFYRNNMDIYWSIPSLAEQGSKNGIHTSTLDYGQR